ncbi:PAS domain-containing protein [Cellulomonas sp. PS-H5]|uniref:PAS domain-containing protein n=1 Tax=Cellulomonas sp. PS-H5 TaxID=2820400 RepID=UPI001C500A37|nr:PAS domain-containing protein [Cellulomonas sp. PS-H5]MBW0255853.1 PAS domain-containing protein [Cellulomonas sp. PS-H5]
MAEHVEPTGAVRAVGARDLIFSTTDGRGVIESANQGFTRVAAHPWSALVGAPHNIIRHPQMPAGAFKLMWDTLQAGRPFSAYVQNLAGDGAAYWVFATVTPLGDGYLSVRIAPGVEAFWSAAAGAYADVLVAERQARAEGLGGVAVAEAGCARLAERIGQLGFADAEEFMHTVMPAEVLAMAERRRPVDPAEQHAGPVGTVLATCVAVDQEVAGLMARLDGLHALADRLREVERDALTAVAALAEVTELAQHASETVSQTAPVLLSTAGAMSTLGDEVAEMLADLVPELATARRAVLRVRFRIALARLHGDAVVDAAREIDRGSAQLGPEHLAQLCACLRDDLATANRDLADGGAVLRRVGAGLEVAHDRLRRTDRFLATWRVQVPRYQVSRQLAPYVSPIDGRLRMSHEQLAALRDLADRCAAEAQPFDDGPLRVLVDRVAAAARGLEPAGVPPLSPTGGPL